MADNIVDVLLRARMDASDVASGVGQIQKALNNLTIPKGISENLDKSFEKLTPLIKDYQKQLDKMSRGNATQRDVKNFNLLKDKIADVMSDIEHEMSTINGQELKIKTDVSALKELKKELENSKQLIKNTFNDAFGKGGSAVGTKQMVKEVQDAFNSAFSTGTLKFPALAAMGDELKKLFDKKDLVAYNNLINEIKNKIAGLKKESQLELAKSLGMTPNKKGEYGDVLDFLNRKLSDLAANKGAARTIDETKQKVNELNTEIKNLEKNQGSNAFQNYNAAISTFNTLKESIMGSGQAASQAASSLANATEQVRQLQQSTQYFFSLRNMINLLKRGVKEAVESVKELDKAMTATAVVTNFDVSDMWAKLPEYTELANKLGATTQGAYETMTLYYQQGLDTNQAFEIGAETMKMARIAGLDYTKTTDMMTAALRGFNMELNETSAKHINDVYSNLAAKTASDTKEIGTAMQRTASIAASAGMSFEGTAAFLAQAIETTREPAENLGTAMKTIVARFTELKKNPLEITEVDGEEVSYNKVDTALQSIGVSLKDANGQFRDLDEVFLDISQRWDSLTQTQQRYIATTAAGSRQQSRFIAMMSNYERTTQLMEAATDSVGASDEQFGKTMESLEAKINKLHNAWQEFTMGIANNSMIKTAVDGLTSFLNITNKVIDALSFGSGGVKSFLSIFAAFTGLKASGRLINSLIGGLGGLIDPTSSFKTGFHTGVINSGNGGQQQAAMIYSPIVAELRNLRAVLTNEKTLNSRGVNPYDQYNRFQQARKNLNEITASGKEYTAAQYYRRFGGLTGEQQAILRQGTAWSAQRADQSLWRFYGNNKDVRKAQNLFKTEAKKSGFWDQYAKSMSDPVLVRKALDACPNVSPASKQIVDGLAEATEIQAKQHLKDLYAKRLRATTTASEENILKAAEAKANQKWEAMSEQRRSALRRGTFQRMQKEGGSPKIPGVSGVARALEGIGKFGSSISSAGIGLQTFGSLLTSTANPALQTFGTALVTLGGLLNGAGGLVSGLGTAIPAIAESAPMVAVFGSAATAATGGLFALAAALALLVGAIKLNNKKIKEEAEKVTTNYKEKSEKNQSNIANLKQWKEELVVLSKGVDKNGNNINLDTSDYQHYLEIVDGIAKINPAIVQGYNAQGHAIIDNNKALSETLALEQQRSKEILDAYTNEDAWNALIKQRNKEIKTYTGGGEKTDAGITVQANGKLFKQQIEQRKQMHKLALELQKNSKFVDLTGFDFSLDELASGSDEAAKKFEQNFDSIRQRISQNMEAAGDEWESKSKENIEKIFSTYSEESDKLDEVIQPMYESMSAYATDKARYSEISDSLKTGFQQTLRNLASNANITTESDMRNAVNNALAQFEHFGSEYEDIMRDVDSARETFADNFNEQEYQANVDKPINDLERLKKTFENTPGGSALVQWIDNEIAKIRQHTSSGVASVEEAWNTLTDKISMAESALDEFSSETEKDYDTAAKGMKEIYDTAMDEEAYHYVGNGDKTWWAAARKLIGSDNLMDLSNQEVYNKMKSLGPMLKEGPEGYIAFRDKVASLSKDIAKDIDGVQMASDGWFKSIDENANPEVWAQIAEKLGMSEEMLTSMINKSRQFRDWDLWDLDAIRESYANDDRAIKSQDGSNKLFISDAELRAQMGDSYYQKEEREDKINGLLSKNIEVLPEELKNITKDQINAIGAKNTADMISILGKTGEYDKTQIHDAAEAAAKLQEGDKFDSKAFENEFAETWASYLDNQEYPTLQPLQSIESLVASIASSVANNQIAQGDLRNSNKQGDELKDKIFGEAGDDTLANYFRKGLGADGQPLDAYTYQTSLNELEKLKGSGEDYLASLREGLGNAKNDEQRALYEQEIASVTNSLDALDRAIAAGKEKWEEFNSVDNPETPNAPNEGASKEPDASGANWEKNVPGWLATIIKNSENSELKTDDAELQAAEASQQGAIKAANQIGDILNGLFNGGDGEAPAMKYQNGTDDSNEANQAFDNTVSQFTEGTTLLTTAGNNLDAAASSLNTAADKLSGSDIETSKSEITQGTTVPGVGFVKSEQPKIENQSSTFSVDGEQALATLNSILNKAQETQDVINTGATFNIETPGANKLIQASDAAKKLTDNSGTKTINVQTSQVDTKQVSSGVKTINSTEAKIKVGASVDSAIAAARRAQKTINGLSAKINISPNFTGTWRKNLDVYEVKHKAAKGQNNHGTIAAPSFGSAARGYGQIGPKGKGGLTLTGELGYEVAWLPNENRSMILGADGPQMVDLPKNAVVWDHKQSKKILKQNAIPAGSQATSKTTIRSGGENLSGYGNSGNSSRSTSAAVKKAADTVKKAAEDSAKTITRVSVWWENIARRAEASQRKVDKNQKAFEKYLKEMSATLKTTSTLGGGDDYINNISNALGIYQAELSRATAELQQLDIGTVGKSQKAKKAAYKKGDVNIEQISYKKGKKTKNEYVNLADYIVGDQVSQAALNSIKNTEKRKAVADAANKELNDRISKRNTAQDNIEKLEEVLEKMGEQLYETFFAWENELTKIWNLTQKIENSENKISRIKSYQDTLNKQISTGLAKQNEEFSKSTFEAFQKGLQESLQEINAQTDAIDKQKEALTNALSLNDELATLSSINSQLDERQKLDDALSVKRTAENNLSAQKTKKTNAQNQIDSLKKQKKKAKTKKEKNKIQKQIDAQQKIINSANAEITKYTNEVATATQKYNDLLNNEQTYLSDTEKAGYEKYAKALSDQLEAQAAAQKYLSVTQNADGTISIEFNTEAFEADKLKGLLGEEQGKAIQEYVKNLVETNTNLNQAYKNTQDGINDLYEQLDSLQDAWKEYANELWDISEAEAKKEAEHLKKLSDSISNALKDLLDEVKRKLDDRRKAEDNAKTEADISKKQQRLAALRADTSGSNAVEIAKLEQEISEAQQSYQRTLEDQLLDKMQEQADLAAKQRERQIELQEAIAEGINNATLVDLWMSDPEEYRDQIYEAYKTANDYDKKPQALKDSIDRNFESLMDGLTNNQKEQEELSKAIISLSDVLAMLKDSIAQMNQITNTKSIAQLKENGLNYQQIKNAGFNALDFKAADVSYEDAKSAGFTDEELEKGGYEIPKVEPTTNTEPQKEPTVPVSTSTPAPVTPKKLQGLILSQQDFTTSKNSKKQVKALQEFLNIQGYKDENNKKLTVDGNFGAHTKAAFKKFKTAMKKKYGLTDPSSYGFGSGARQAVAKFGYKKGGLADYTGPAWLDGTPSKPELVLNAADTKNFIALKDVLSKAMSSTSSISDTSYGDMTYEININVEKLTSDYDVDKVAERVKKIIVKDSSYRNVTQVRRLR